MNVEFVLRGKTYALSRQGVEKTMKGVMPEKIATYYIAINGEKYPPKQVISKSLSLGKVEFTTMDATNILRRLGYFLETNKNK